MRRSLHQSAWSLSLPLNSPQSSTDESKVTSERDRSYFLPRPRYPVTVLSGILLTVANDGSGNEQRLADSCLSLHALRSEHEEAKLSSGETGSSGELCDCNNSVVGFHVRSSSRDSSGVGPAADSELRCDAVREESAKCAGNRSRCDSVIRRGRQGTVQHSEWWCNERKRREKKTKERKSRLKIC